MSGRIFISYRRGDDPGHAGRLFDGLQQAFARDQLFMDVDNIEPGLDFLEVVQDRIAESDVLLAVIGSRWVQAEDSKGRRRLDNPDDFVRVEIEAALAQKKRVIPVLVGEGQMPSPEDLPDSLRALARRNAVRVTHERFRSDLGGLIEKLKIIVGGGAKPAPAGTSKPATDAAEAAPRRVEIGNGVKAGLAEQAGKAPESTPATASMHRAAEDAAQAPPPSGVAMSQAVLPRQEHAAPDDGSAAASLSTGPSSVDAASAGTAPAVGARKTWLAADRLRLVLPVTAIALIWLWYEFGPGETPQAPASRAEQVDVRASPLAGTITRSGSGCYVVVPNDGILGEFRRGESFCDSSGRPATWVESIYGSEVVLATTRGHSSYKPGISYNAPWLNGLGLEVTRLASDSTPQLVALTFTKR
jgi:hypothetical protein